MDLKALTQLFSLRDLRNAGLGLIIVLGGIGLSTLTYYAHLNGNSRLAGISAGISLIFVLLILIFVVPPLARNASKEASQLNLPFEFTAGGAVMLGLLMIVGFSAWSSGNNLLFLVIAVLASSMVVGFFAGSLCLKKLDVKMRFPETIFAGQETSILVSIHNRKRIFSSYSVVAEVRGRERETSSVLEDLRKLLPGRLADRFARAPIVRRTLSYFVQIPRNSSVENKGTHIFEHRGRFLIKDFELSTRFPFGFFRHRRRLAARETELLVFPKVESIGGDLESMPLDAGKLASGKRGSGQDLLAMRDYQPNDDLRRIDWKATARTRSLMVREFAADDERRITIYLDTRVMPEARAKMTLRERIEAENAGRLTGEFPQFEAAVSGAASIAARYCNSGADVRLVIDRSEGEFGTGSLHLHECLRRLAVVQPRIDQESVDPAPFDFERNYLDTPESQNVLLTCLSAPDNPSGIQVISFT